MRPYFRCANLIRGGIASPRKYGLVTNTIFPPRSAQKRNNHLTKTTAMLANPVYPADRRGSGLGPYRRRGPHSSLGLWVKTIPASLFHQPLATKNCHKFL